VANFKRFLLYWFADEPLFLQPCLTWCFDGSHQLDWKLETVERKLLVLGKDSASAAVSRLKFSV